MDTLTAAQQIDEHALSSSGRRMLEGRITSSKTVDSFDFLWDGVSPIRATLVWTDPAGTPKSGFDNRAAALVNDLDLSITDPNAVVHRPFVLPHVGDWSLATLDDPATTGVNHVDNVEQVLLASPGLPGTYTVTVALTGGLTGTEQAFSLVVSGGTLPAATPALANVTGLTCDPSPALIAMDGAGLHLGATVRLHRPGYADLVQAGSEVFTDGARARLDLRGVTPGWWNLRLRNPDTTGAVIPHAVAVPLTLAFEDMEGSLANWSTGTSGNGIAWVSATVQGAPGLYLWGQGSSNAGTSDLLYTPVTFPAGATCCLLSFQQWYSLQTSADAAVLEVSFDGGGTWIDIIAAGGTFVEGGYTGTLSTPSNPIGPSGTPVWTGTGLTFGAFFRTTVALDAGLFAGQTVRFRWRLGSNNGTSSIGWVIDDVVISADVSGVWQAFEYWRFNTLGDAFADETANLDGDRLTRFGEYAFGTDENAPDASPTTVTVSDGYLHITFPIRLEATDLTYTVQIATSPDSWTDAAVYTSNGAGVQRNLATNTIAAGQTPDGVRLLVTERHAVPIAGATRQFMRVVATRTSP
jgi:hypothetical protein